MVWNLHPIFVHFPIALLSVYCLMEFIRFKNIINHRVWFYIKASFLFIGVLGAIGAFLSGLLIKSKFLIGDSTKIVRMHELFAILTILIFLVLALIYFVSLLYKKKENVNSWFVFCLALLGLILLTITGALGGIIAFGPDIDPLTSFLYKLFFKV